MKIKGVSWCMMTHEGEIRRINSETAYTFYRILDQEGFEPAMRTLTHNLHLEFEQPLVVTLQDNGQIEVDFLTKPLPYDTFRQLLGY